MKLYLSNNGTCLIDSIDFISVSKFKWRSHKINGKVYVTNGKTYLHRFLENPGKGMEVDHINGNGLDNRRINLRVCRHMNNQMNRMKHSVSSSKFKGVTWNKADKIWYAKIYPNGRDIYLGSFRDERRAAKAYDKAAVIYYGEYARTNFKENQWKQTQARGH